MMTEDTRVWHSNICSKWTGECEFAKITHFPGQPSVYYICLLLHLSATSLKAWLVAARKSRTWFEKNHEDHPRGVAREDLLHLRISARTQGQVGLKKYQPYQSWSCGRLDKRQRFGKTAKAFSCAKKSSCRCLEVIPLWYIPIAAYITQCEDADELCKSLM